MKLNLPPHCRFLVAFSGGSDSLSLLSFMTEEERSRSLALYVNHGIRNTDEIEKEIELNRKNAELLGVRFLSVSLGSGEVERLGRDKGCGIEAAARELRYKVLEEYRKKFSFDYILTAHHQKDQIETIIMRIMSSSPFWTWGGIREKDGKILRPLFSFKKEEILKELKGKNLSWSEDSTNDDDSYKRNWIRHNVIPSINEYEKDILIKISENVKKLPHRTIENEIYGKVRGRIARDSFLTAFPWDREKVLYEALNSLGNKDRITRSFISEVLKGANRGEGRCEKGNIKIRFLKNWITFIDEPSFFETEYRGEETILPLNIRISLSKNDSLTLEIPGNALENARLRKTKKEDRIQLKDGWRKISSLLKDYHLPFAIVLEKNDEIVAMFSSFLGGRDRLSLPYLGKKGIKVNILSS